MKSKILLMGVFLLSAFSTALAKSDTSQRELNRPLNAVLKAYVINARVDYSALKKNPGELAQFLKSLAQFSPKTYAAWPRNNQIAFLINAYNALTLEAIISHYPIQATFPTDLVYPKNSIREIPGVWTDLKFLVMGQKRALGEIENKILRQGFQDPRVHMALVCASKGCPPLKGRAYDGRDLDRQLKDQARLFLQNPQKFRINRARGQVFLSSIFKWFGADFVKNYEPTSGFGERSKDEKAALNFISQYISPDNAAYLRSGNFSVSYLDYDWSLNERKTP